jgi:hypothetical protein
MWLSLCARGYFAESVAHQRESIKRFYTIAECKPFIRRIVIGFRAVQCTGLGSIKQSQEDYETIPGQPWTWSRCNEAPANADAPSKAV